MTRIYQIRIEGYLDTRWQDWFDGVSVTLEEDGTTLLSVPVPDQPALYGLLRKVRDLGPTLISVTLLQDSRNQNNPHKGEIEMNTNKKIDKKVLLSTLWIVVMINMLKADILSLFIPGATEEVVKTSSSTGVPIPQLMLGGAIAGELALVMIILSRVLKYGVNRWVNIIVGTVTIAYTWAGSVAYPHYTFIATVETVCLLLIIWNAWKWSGSEE